MAGQLSRPGQNKFGVYAGTLVSCTKGRERKKDWSVLDQKMEATEHIFGGVKTSTIFMPEQNPVHRPALICNMDFLFRRVRHSNLQKIILKSSHTLDGPSQVDFFMLLRLDWPKPTTFWREV